MDTIGDRYRLPNLGNRDDGDVVNAVRDLLVQESQRGTSYIYPIPSTLNCGGTVTAVEYCYRTGNQLGTEQLVFTLLTLQQSGLDFTITDVIPISSTPTSAKCTPGPFFGLFQFCCDIISLDMMKSFFLPAENFAFGLVTSSSADFVAYEDEFLVDRFRYSQANFNAPIVGDSITLTESNRESNEPLWLLQFFISK